LVPMDELTYQSCRNSINRTIALLYKLKE